MLSNGFLPSCADANETCPAVCQSCVITTLPNPLAILLMIGTTCSPSFTARLPRGRKQFWTSITSSTDVSSGLIAAAAQSLLDVKVVIAVALRPARTCRRSHMTSSLVSQWTREQRNDGGL